jgi:hypothetical protein
MVGMPFAVAFLALFMSLAALQFYSSIGLDELVGAMTPAQAVRALLPVATMGTFLAAVVSIYRRQMYRVHLPKAPVGVICGAVGVMEFLSVQPAAQGGGRRGSCTGDRYCRGPCSSCCSDGHLLPRPGARLPSRPR